MQTEIKHTWFFSQSPGEVWEYLTKPDLMALWLMKNDFKPEMGHSFQFRTNPIPALDLDGIFHCKVLEIIPLRKLTYSWKGGSENNPGILDTIVAWTLEPKDGGTTLNLVHSGFKEKNIDIFNGMNKGWADNIQKVVKHLNSKYNAGTSA